MTVRMFRRIGDYRGRGGNVCELNFIGRAWNLRLMLSRRFGLSLWRNHRQIARLNYPAV